MKVAVIPARGGSKRIPRKNIKPFCGLPMISRPIRAALESGCFDRVVVSTDDVEIAQVAQAYGAEVPFMRPDHLADDLAGTVPVIRHAVKWLINEGCNLKAACCIYATAPFLRPSDLKDGLSALVQKNSDFAFSVTSFSFPIQRALRITPDGHVQMFEPQHMYTRSQDLEEAYHDAGVFYWGTRDAWLSDKHIFAAGSVPVVLPRYRVQDIDTPEDWTTAELMFKAMETNT